MLVAAARWGKEEVEKEKGGFNVCLCQETVWIGGKVSVVQPRLSSSMNITPHMVAPDISTNLQVIKTTLLTSFYLFFSAINAPQQSSGLSQIQAIPISPYFKCIYVFIFPDLLLLLMGDLVIN